MSGLRLLLVLNPEDLADRRTSVTAPQGDRVFMRIFVTNESPEPITFDQITAEIYANHGANVLALAPSDCPHAGKLVDSGERAVCAVSRREVKSGGLGEEDDPANGTPLDLVQTLMPGQQVGGFGLGTGKAGIISQGRPFVLQPGETIQVADGRSRSTGMIASELGSTPVIALGFASIKGVPLTVVPAYATATITEPIT